MWTINIAYSVSPLYLVISPSFASTDFSQPAAKCASGRFAVAVGEMNSQLSSLHDSHFFVPTVGLFDLNNVVLMTCVERTAKARNATTRDDGNLLQVPPHATAAFCQHSPSLDGNPES